MMLALAVALALALALVLAVALAVAVAVAVAMPVSLAVSCGCGFDCGCNTCCFKFSCQLQQLQIRLPFLVGQSRGHLCMVVHLQCGNLDGMVLLRQEAGHGRTREMITSIVFL